MLLKEHDELLIVGTGTSRTCPRPLWHCPGHSSTSWYEKCSPVKPARAAEAPPKRKMQIARVATMAREKAAIMMASLLRGEDADAVEMDVICWNMERNGLQS